jgi:protein involved in polysaccharide export with SLBB domain
LTTQEAEIRQQAFDFRRDLLARLRTVQLDGRVVVHLRPLEQFAGSVADVEVEPGDRLEIPQVPKYVNVLGEVFNRAALVYNPKHTVADYLQQVGGLRADALEKEIYLVQLDGTVISNSQSQFAVVSDQGQTVRFRDFFAVKPQPGDSIVVPRRTQEPATLRNIRDIVQIVFQGIGTAGILAALF